MIEEDFYATLKLKSGEEIFGKVIVSEEQEESIILIHTPVTICELKSRSGIAGYKLELWLKTSSEDLFVENLLSFNFQ